MPRSVPGRRLAERRGSAVAYVPERGDLVWITLNPQAGHEQAGRRPAVVVSPRSYNGKVGLGLFCPITSQVKGYPFEVALPAGLPIKGVVLADQVKSLDWRARQVEFAARLPASASAEVVGKLAVLLEG
jgi:mRNA interferase MazF